MAVLLVLSDVHRGTCIPLAHERTVLGRGSQCDVVINLPSASREHACISRAGGQFFLEDLGSRNGTFVRGARVSHPVRLADRDEVRLGSVVMTFRVFEPTDTESLSN